MRNPARGERAGWVVRRLAAAIGLTLVVAAPSLPPAGPVLLDVLSPEPGQTVGLTGVELLVRFRTPRAANETFRALLNGADVTDLLATSENGSHGQLLGLLPGDNVLRLEIFGRVPGASSRLFEQTRVIRIRMRPPLELDRGERAAPMPRDFAQHQR